MEVTVQKIRLRFKHLSDFMVLIGFGIIKWSFALIIDSLFITANDE